MIVLMKVIDVQNNLLLFAYSIGITAAWEDNEAELQLENSR